MRAMRQRPCRSAMRSNDAGGPRRQITIPRWEPCRRLRRWPYGPGPWVSLAGGRPAQLRRKSKLSVDWRSNCEPLCAPIGLHKRTSKCSRPPAGLRKRMEKQARPKLFCAGPPRRKTAWRNFRLRRARSSRRGSNSGTFCFNKAARSKLWPSLKRRSRLRPDAGGHSKVGLRPRSRPTTNLKRGSTARRCREIVKRASSPPRSAR